MLLSHQLARRGTHFRSDLKLIARDVVVQVYRFKGGSGENAKKYNISHAQTLINDCMFAWPVSVPIIEDMPPLTSEDLCHSFLK